MASSSPSAADAKLAQFLGGKQSPTASPQLQPAAAAGFTASDAKLADFLGSKAAANAPAVSADARSAATGSGLGALEAVASVASDVRRVFERRDADLDGKLSMPEVTAALADLHLDVEPRRLRTAFIDLDTDQDFK
jgi:hypothetical protein